MEPEGTVEIKFRRKDLVKTMRRVDPIYTSLAEKLGESSTSILIIALLLVSLAPSALSSFQKMSNISGGSMCAFTVALYLALIVSSSLHSLGRRVNHSLLRSITSSPVSPAQPIDFPLGLRATVVQCCVGLGAVGELVEWRVCREWFERLQIGIDRNQSLVTAAQGLWGSSKTKCC